MAEKNPSSRSYAPQGGLSAAVNRDIKPALAPTTNTWAEAVTRFLPFAGDAWGMDDAKTEYQKGNKKTAAAMGGMNAIGMGGLGGILVGKYGARNAALAGNSAIDDSQRMAYQMQGRELGYGTPLQKVNPLELITIDREIWDKTGRKTGYPSSIAFPDGHIQTEIDDSAAKFVRFPPNAQMGEDIHHMEGLTQDFLPHEELYTAYPELAKDKTVILPQSKMLGPDNVAYRGPGVNGLSSQYLKNTTEGGLDPKGSLLHEMQHAIDATEGMGSGASTEYFERHLNKLRPTAEKYHELMKAVREAGVPYNSPYFREIERALRMEVEPFFRKIGSWNPDTAYFKTAGEAKARLVDARRDLPMADRRRIHPLSFKQDYPMGDDFKYVMDIPTLMQQVRGKNQELRDKWLAQTDFPGSDFTRQKNGTYRHDDDVSTYANAGWEDEPEGWAEGGLVDDLVGKLTPDEMEELLVELHPTAPERFAEGGLVLDPAKGLLSNGMNLVNPTNKHSAPLDIPLNTNNMMAHHRAGTDQAQLYRTR
jgi:hypothetical protein